MRVARVTFEKHDIDGTIWTSELTPMGEFVVKCVGPKKWDAVRGMRRIGGKSYASSDEAKEACQTYFKHRIEEWLELEDGDIEGPDMANPDYIYDPVEWEVTYEYGTRDEMAEGDFGPFGTHGVGKKSKIKQYKTLIHGPDKFAAEVVISRDEDGDPDETEIRFFDTLEEAEAAIQ